MRLITLFLLGVALLNSCKKNVEFSSDLRPNEFWARYTMTDDSGNVSTYAYQGEDTTHLVDLSNFVVSLDYFTQNAIEDSIKQITVGLSELWTGTPISIRLNANSYVTDPFFPTEWTAAELEELLYPGKTFQFGDGPGQAQIQIEGYPYKKWICTSSSSSNQNGFMRVLEVRDYGAPEVDISYFGKKVKLAFSCTMTHQSGSTWTLTDGEAVLLFRYYKF